MSEQGGGGNWRRSRMLGVLPEGSRVRRIDHDASTYIEHGEKTWTTGQTIRDILQNHLDAQTQKFVDQLTASVLDVDKLKDMKFDEEQEGKFTKFVFELFRYRKSLRDLPFAAEREMRDLLQQAAEGLPLKKDLTNEQGLLDTSKLKSTVEPIEEHTPTVRYYVVDPSSGEEARWVNRETLQDMPENYQIQQMEIADEGVGFDSKLTAFYKSTKGGRPWLRGKFGEGAKMSQVHLLRNGAKVEMRSRYFLNGEETKHERMWKSRPYVSEDKTVQQKGVEVALPPGVESGEQGSRTVIDISHANPEFQKEFRENADPRSERGLRANCLEYSSQEFYYPIGVLDNEQVPLGVSLTGDSRNAYVQGLLVPLPPHYEGKKSLYFTYNILDSSFIAGRDRNALAYDVAKFAHKFWMHVESPHLVRELLQRVLVDKTPIDVDPLGSEFGVLRDIAHQTKETSHPSQKRALATILQQLPDVLQLQPHVKTVVVQSSSFEKEADRDLITLLSQNGYSIKEVGSYPSHGLFTRLREDSEKRYDTYTLYELRQNAPQLLQEMKPEDERTTFAREIFTGARSDITRLLEAAGMTKGLNIIEEPEFVQAVDMDNDRPLEMVFDAEKKAFRLRIRPALLKTEGEMKLGVDYWRLRMQVEMLGSYARDTEFSDRNAQAIWAQDKANSLLHLTMKPGLADVDAMPAEFAFKPKMIGADEQMQRYFTEILNLQENRTGFNAYRIVKQFDPSVEILSNITDILPMVPVDFRPHIIGLLRKRIFIKDGAMYWFDGDWENTKITPQSQKLQEMKQLTSIGDQPVYEVGHRLAMPFTVPENGMVKMRDGSKLVFYMGKTLHYLTDGRFEEYSWSNRGLMVDHGCIYKTRENSDDIQADIQNFRDELEGMELVSPEREGERMERFEPGIVRTPLPVEYGKDEWDNPVRVFEDILQNHIDAAPDGKVQLAYEVTRPDGRYWVTEDSMTPEDIIVGLIVMDKGRGYNPKDLGTLGKSSKKSPLFAGKYGEGQKMLAAAAARNNFSLTFTSTINGTQDRWSADVQTADYAIDVDEGFSGAKREAVTKRVVYNVTAAEPLQSNLFTSATMLRLPEQANDGALQTWSEWVKIMDPRVKDERGNGGLSRYALALRKPSDQVIDLGYMRILLDEPGAVYENGLLVDYKPDSTAVGYDVPEVVSTRERNRYDEGLFNSYVGEAMKYCNDDRYHTVLMGKFNEKYAGPMRRKNEYFYIQEKDLSFAHVFSKIAQSGTSFVPSRGMWRAAFRDQVGNALIHSQKNLERDLKHARDWLEKSDGSGTARTRYDELVRIQDNIGHIPSDRILDVGEDWFGRWDLLFPTVKDYLADLSVQKIPVPEAVLQQLDAVTNGSASVIGEVTRVAQQNPDRLRTLEAVLGMARTPDKLEDKYGDRKRNLDRMRMNIEDWKRPDASKVFVAPASAGYLGLAEKTQVGYNEMLLANRDIRILPMVARHELVHKIFELPDYVPEFSMVLLQLAEANLQRAA